MGFARDGAFQGLKRNRERCDANDATDTAEWLGPRPGRDVSLRLGYAGRGGVALRDPQAVSATELPGAGVPSRGLRLVSRLCPPALVVEPAAARQST